MGTLSSTVIDPETSTTKLKKDYKMPGGGRQVTNSGTNNGGSSYTSYSGGGYSYSNPSGSRYYNTGSGHGFYNSGSSGTKSSGGVLHHPHQLQHRHQRHQLQGKQVNK